MSGKVTFDEHVEVFERYCKVIYHIHSQKLNVSLSKSKGPQMYNFALCYFHPSIPTLYVWSTYKYIYITEHLHFETYDISLILLENGF